MKFWPDWKGWCRPVLIPSGLEILIGDFNKANLSRELPKYRPHVTCPTRDSNILNRCYTTIKDAYRSVPRAALGLSVHLIPTYRQKLKSAKPVIRPVKRWIVFEAAATDLDELIATVTSYINLCEDMCILTRTFLSFNNDKPCLLGNSNSLVRPKRMLTEVGIKSCITRPGTD